MTVLPAPEQPKAATRRDQAQLMREVRAALVAADCTAARWTSGGYCLRHKESVHRNGFRVSEIEERTACRLDYEVKDDHAIWVAFDGGTIKREALGQRYLRWYRVLAKYEQVLRPAGFVCEAYHPVRGNPYLVVRRRRPRPIPIVAPGQETGDTHA